MGPFPDPILNLRLITKGQFVLFGVIALIADIAFDLHASAERRKEFDVTDKIASLGSDINLHLNQVFKSDIVCLWDKPLILAPTLESIFPGKTFLKWHEYYDVSEEGVGYHLVTVDDANPTANIFDVSSGVINKDGEADCCSRDLVARIRKTGKKRIISVVEPETLCLKTQ